MADDSRLDWRAIEPLLEWDGSLLDLYVLDATLEAWEAVIDELRRRWPAVYVSDGVESPFPGVSAAFAATKATAVCLAFDVGPLTVNCHFFETSEIELDLDPRELAAPGGREALADVIELIAAAAGNPCRLTPENGPDLPILECTPGRPPTWTWRAS